MKKGFTLIELLVVMSIISVLSGLVLANFRTSQFKGRDAQRKANLQEVAKALEVFANDYNRYPNANNDGEILGCSYSATNPPTSGPCIWGMEAMTDGNVDYIKLLPDDPNSNYDYWYRASSDGSKYQLYARLENSQDPDIDQAIVDLQLRCGGVGIYCNFGIASPNATTTESL